MKSAVALIIHDRNEREYAIALRELLATSFPGKMDLFLLSDDPLSGSKTKWHSNAEKAVRESAVAVIIAGPETVSQPWLNFVAGMSAERGIPIFILLHSGLKPADLPVHLRRYDSGAVKAEAGVKDLVKTVSLVADLPAIMPDAAWFVETVAGLDNIQSEFSLGRGLDSHSGAEIDRSGFFYSYFAFEIGYAILMIQFPDTAKLWRHLLMQYCDKMGIPAEYAETAPENVRDLISRVIDSLSEKHGDEIVRYFKISAGAVGMMVSLNNGEKPPAEPFLRELASASLGEPLVAEFNGLWESIPTGSEGSMVLLKWLNKLRESLRQRVIH